MDLCLIGAEQFSWLSPASWLAILKVVAGLGLVIFVHEMGHFLVAKACGVKCEKFYLGFDAFDIKIGDFVLVPRKLLKFTWGETEYGIGIIPLGGYVKMLGQDDNPANAARERERSRLNEQDGSPSPEDADDPASDAGRVAVENAADSSATEAATRAARESSEATYEMDPRSYQAKSVPQRMAIISAGVIMNLIFAVIFATIAYGIGAPYTPCVIGGVAPGGPAWVQDVQPGSRVVQVGENGERRQHMRFQRDLIHAIIFNGENRDLKLYLVPPGSETEQVVSVRPSSNLYEIRGAVIPLIGVSPSSSLTLAQTTPLLAEHAADGSGLQGGDRIVALKILGTEHPTEDYAAMKALLAQYPDCPITFVVERGDLDDPTRVECLVPTNPMRLCGLEMSITPIRAVQVDSPAERDGLQVGDEIISIDGAPVGDPFTLADRLRLAAEDGRTLPVVIRRANDNGGDSELTLQVTPRRPRTRYTSIEQLPLAIDELGICLGVTNTVSGVTPGSSAETLGLRQGDVVSAIQFVPANDERKAIEQEMTLLHKEIDLTKNDDLWPVLFENMQHRLVDTKVRVTFQRGEETKQVELSLRKSDQWNQRSRGIFLEQHLETHRAESLGEAFTLGVRQTKEDAFAVFGFLRKLFTREISPVNLGGPGTIAVGATSEAMNGEARLLLFLTLLSANLAIVNFLPIPILDGGHMVFLTWEAIFRKPLSERVMVTLSMAGLLFIVSLMVFVISLDIWRFIPV